MDKKALYRIQQKIKNRDYVFSPHAYEEMVEDGFFEEDVTHGILSGKITSRQKDPQSGE